MQGSISYYIQDLGGVATATQLKKAGFAPGSIDHALKQGKIDRLTRGVYCSTDVLDDEFAAVTKRWPKCILSHGSALYLLGLSDRTPGSISVSVPHGYNPQGLKTTFSNLEIHRESEKVYGLGRTELKDPMGILVSSYDAERTVADVIKAREKGETDAQLVKDSIAGYFKRRDRNLPRLSKMCEALGVRDELQRYLEVLT